MMTSDALSAAVEARQDRRLEAARSTRPVTSSHQGSADLGWRIAGRLVSAVERLVATRRHSTST